MDQITVDQPKPKFNLTDLEQKLAIIYSFAQQWQRFPEQLQPAAIAGHIGNIQELFGQVTKNIIELEPIEIIGKSYEQEVQDKLQTEKPQFHVCGVQLWQNGKLAGTSLYSTVIKARKIRDICNAEYAKLKVNHEAKIINYPVF